MGVSGSLDRPVISSDKFRERAEREAGIKAVLCGSLRHRKRPAFSLCCVRRGNVSTQVSILILQCVLGGQFKPEVAAGCRWKTEKLFELWVWVVASNFLEAEGHVCY